MSSIFDYITWRGDLPLESVPFNEIDALIFCEFAYLKLKGIVPQEFSREGVTIAQAAAAFFASPDVAARSDMGLLFGEQVLTLFRAMAASRRYGQLRLCGFVEELDTAQEKQFAAVTVILEDGSLLVVFRGTDDSLVGWKEDFNMMYMTPIPSQQSALSYLGQAAARLPGKIRLGGHSKGGNLSVYVATFCGHRLQRRILDVYNNDGPGFELSITEAPEYQEIAGRVHTFVPEESVVGLLLEHNEDYTVVRSHASGLLQHDMLSWQLDGPRFSVREELSGRSQLLESSVGGWLKEMSAQEREQFVDALFDILASSQATNLTELAENWKRNPAKAMNSLLKIDYKVRKAVRNALLQLAKSVYSEWSQDVKATLLELLQREE